MPIRITAIAISLLVAPTALAAPAEAVDVHVRPGVTMRYLAITPGGQPRGAVILLAGGNGVLRLSPSGTISNLGGNFLICTREQFARHDLFVAALDAASDRLGGMNGPFRLSEQHAQDIGKVVADVKTRTGAPVWLVGTSAGTLSGANAGARLSGSDQAMRPHGIVLTSTMTTLDAAGYCGRSVYEASLGEIRMPVLVVSHENDGCQCSPGSSAVGARLLASLARAPAKELKIFTGGSDPISGPCDARAPHGFFGIEDSVVEFIADWIKTH